MRPKPTRAQPNRSPRAAGSRPDASVRPERKDESADAREPARTVGGPGRGVPAATSGDADGILLALLPLRVFLGLTFIYAGLDKLLTPAFLRASGVGSIGQQLQGFTRDSPLTPLIQAIALPQPELIGLLMAIAEIAVGLGALFGLLYRASALGGAGIALLFWLTASWSTTPYYYGPDLPYAAGWLTLAFVGRPGRFALDPWFADGVARADERWRRRRQSAGLVEELEDALPASSGRRTFLQGALLGLGAIGVAVVGGFGGRFLRGDDSAGTALGGVDGGANPTATPAAGAASPVTAASPGGASSGGQVITTLSQLPKGNALPFQDPSSGDPAILVRLADGNVVAFDAVCTHAGCTVGYDPGSSLLVCPCHGAAFDPAHQAAVVGGPTNQPLAGLPIKVDQSSGRITLVG